MKSDGHFKTTLAEIQWRLLYTGAWTRFSETNMMVQYFTFFVVKQKICLLGQAKDHQNDEHIPLFALMYTNFKSSTYTGTYLHLSGNTDKVINVLVPLFPIFVAVATKVVGQSGPK